MPAGQDGVHTNGCATQHNLLHLALKTGNHLGITCLLQVLARDIRSLHQRKTVLPVVPKQQQQQQGVDGSSFLAQQLDAQSQAVCSTVEDNSRSGTCRDAGATAAAAAESGDVSGTKGRYVVGLDGVSVSYEVCIDTGRVYVRGACLAS
jgi:hypothetical protein